MDAISPKAWSLGYPGSPPRVVTLDLFRFQRLQDRVWAFGQMQLARAPLNRLPGLGFYRLLGAGSGEGFTPIPDPSVVAILTTWPSLEVAEDQTANAAVFRRYDARAAERWRVHLSTISAWGAWGGSMPFPQQGGEVEGPLAALTRATIRPSKLLRFWGQEPAISKAIGTDPNVLFKIGLGEVPWFHQMTFSIWPDLASMAAFARKDGPHAQAIRAVRSGNWFAEELYARFRILDTVGSWGGVNPLDGARLAVHRAAE